MSPFILIYKWETNYLKVQYCSVISEQLTTYVVQLSVFWSSIMDTRLYLNIISIILLNYISSIVAASVFSPSHFDEYDKGESLLCDEIKYLNWFSLS